MLNLICHLVSGQINQGFLYNLDGDIYLDSYFLPYYGIMTSNGVIGYLIDANPSQIIPYTIEDFHADEDDIILEYDSLLYSAQEKFWIEEDNSRLQYVAYIDSKSDNMICGKYCREQEKIMNAQLYPLAFLNLSDTETLRTSDVDSDPFSVVDINDRRFVSYNWGRMIPLDDKKIKRKLRKVTRTTLATKSKVSKYHLTLTKEKVNYSDEPFLQLTSANETYSIKADNSVLGSTQGVINTVYTRNSVKDTLGVMLDSDINIYDLIPENEYFIERISDTESVYHKLISKNRLISKKISYSTFDSTYRLSETLLTGLAPIKISDSIASALIADNCIICIIDGIPCMAVKGLFNRREFKYDVQIIKGTSRCDSTQLKHFGYPKRYNFMINPDSTMIYNTLTGDPIIGPVDKIIPSSDGIITLEDDQYKIYNNNFDLVKYPVNSILDYTSIWNRTEVLTKDGPKFITRSGTLVDSLTPYEKGGGHYHGQRYNLIIDALNKSINIKQTLWKPQDSFPYTIFRDTLLHSFDLTNYEKAKFINNTDSILEYIHVLEFEDKKSISYIDIKTKKDKHFDIYRLIKKNKSFELKLTKSIIADSLIYHHYPNPVTYEKNGRFGYVDFHQSPEFLQIIPGHGSYARAQHSSGVWGYLKRDGIWFPDE